MKEEEFFPRISMQFYSYILLYIHSLLLNVILKIREHFTLSRVSALMTGKPDARVVNLTNPLFMLLSQIVVFYSY